MSWELSIVKPIFARFYGMISNRSVHQSHELHWKQSRFLCITNKKGMYRHGQNIGKLFFLYSNHVDMSIIVKVLVAKSCLTSGTTNVCRTVYDILYFRSKGCYSVPRTTPQLSSYISIDCNIIHIFALASCDSFFARRKPFDTTCHTQPSGKMAFISHIFLMH